MISASLIVLGFVGWTQQHIAFPVEYCSLAGACVHDGRAVCASTPDGCARRSFIDQCDLYEYNCDYGTRYQETYILFCSTKLWDLKPTKHTKSVPVKINATSSSASSSIATTSSYEYHTTHKLISTEVPLTKAKKISTLFPNRTSSVTPVTKKTHKTKSITAITLSTTKPTISPTSLITSTKMIKIKTKPTTKLTTIKTVTISSPTTTLKTTSLSTTRQVKTKTSKSISTTENIKKKTKDTIYNILTTTKRSNSSSVLNITTKIFSNATAVSSTIKLLTKQSSKTVPVSATTKSRRFDEYCDRPKTWETTPKRPTKLWFYPRHHIIQLKEREVEKNDKATSIVPEVMKERKNHRKIVNKCSIFSKIDCQRPSTWLITTSTRRNHLNRI